VDSEAPNSEPAAAVGQRDDAQGRVVNLRYAVPHQDLFFRQQPALKEGPREPWIAVRSVIDFGNALFLESNRLRDERRLKDAVLVALLRRALITAEGTWWLLARGLEEPALGLMRTLYDVELNLKLVAKDPTDRMAKRLAAWHYYSHQRHGEKMLRNRDTREEMLRPYGDIERTIGIARSYAQFLESPVFDDVRDELRTSRYWHGYDRVEDAFAAADASSDYFMLYDGSNFFVHDTNIDFDFVDIADGQIRLRAFVQRDPSRYITPLANTAYRVYSVLGIYIEQKGLPADFEAGAQTGAAERDEDGLEVEHIDSYAGVGHLLLETFGPPQEESSGDAGATT
jgi:hypothetical protein